MTKEYYYAMWKQKCWNCHTEITVTTNFVEFINISSLAKGQLWDKKIPLPIIKILESEGAKIRFTSTPLVIEGYYANICSNCDVVQGDWILFTAVALFIIDYYHNYLKNFKIIKIKDNQLSFQKYLR